MGSFDSFVVGLELGPVQLVVDTERVRGHAFATDDFNRWYLESSPFGGPIAPTTLLTLDDPAFAENQLVTDEDALAARFEIECHQPIRVGATVQLRARHLGRYVKRRRGYVVREFEVRDDRSGATLIRSRLAEAVAAPADGAASYPAPGATSSIIIPRRSSLATAKRASSSVPPESPLEPIAKHVTRKRMFVFSGRAGWWTNIHTDPDFAKSLGFPTCIAQGLMTTAYVVESCVTFFGTRWFTSGRLEVSFLMPVLLDDTIRVNGVVRGLDAVPVGRPRQELELWCENQGHNVVAVARASAELE